MKTCTRGSKDSEIYMPKHAVGDRMTCNEQWGRGLIRVHSSVNSLAPLSFLTSLRMTYMTNR